MRKGLSSVSVLGIVLFLFVTSFPPFDALTELSLAAHMLQHILIMVAGIMVAYPLYVAGKFNGIKSNRTGFIGFIVVAAILVLWHLPPFWDAAVQNFWIHFLEHISFLMAGFLIGSLVLMLPDNFKLFAVALAISAHDIYGFALFLTPVEIYPPSTVSQQALLGILLFAPSPVYVVGYLYYTLTRESRKLEELETGRKVQSSSKIPSFFKGKAVPLFMIALLVLLVSYFAVTSVSIVAASAPGQKDGATVYIVESPVYWQYSPENLTVVLGVNSTVTWISHSFTVDTVTSDTGMFSSPSISPGSTFSFTFTDPGTYGYHCLYHPWMKGTITVLSATP